VEYADLVRNAYEGFAQGDLERILPLLHSDFELHEEPELPGGRVWHGPDGFRAYLNEAGARWRELVVEIDDVTPVNSSTVVVSGTMRGTGSMSGADVDARFGHVFELRDGLAVRMRMFFDREQALEAADSADNENVTLVRRIFDGFAKGDFAGAVEHYDPDIEWAENRSITGKGVYRGLAGLRDGFLDWLSAWDGYRCEADDLIAAGDCVVASVRGSGTGKLSGAEASDAFFMVFWIRDGKVTRIENHREREQALEAAGRERASGASR
jgi:ketosteroid isomerase-like protein